MSVFRKVPPWSLVREVFELLGLRTETPFLFQRTDLKVDNSAEAADLILPYYLPCKASQFFDKLDAHRWMTLLRHLVTPYGYAIESQETTRNRKKTIVYTLQRLADTDEHLKKPIQMDFS